MNISELVKQAHDNAVEKGWWENEPTFGEVIALIHSEASEALEDYRKGRQPTEVYYEKHVLGETYQAMKEMSKPLDDTWKPCGIPSELADICIRVFDVCGRYGIDLEQAITEKMAYNATRAYKHGGKVL